MQAEQLTYRKVNLFSLDPFQPRCNQTVVRDRGTVVLCQVNVMTIYRVQARLDRCLVKEQW